MFFAGVVDDFPETIGDGKTFIINCDHESHDEIIPTIDCDEPVHYQCMSGIVDLDETHESDEVMTQDEFIKKVEGILDKVLEAWKHTTDK